MKKVIGAAVCVICVCFVASVAVAGQNFTSKGDGKTNAPKQAQKKGPSTTAYSRANDKASFKRAADVKGMSAKKDVKAAEKKASETAKGKKKGFLWW